ncbi:hypothetical protein FQN57_000920 [Myotisia sp. PD_48]|nr:hypothetical protein FQN57_000920 [Myotisia sp. PD_48]
MEDDLRLLKDRQRKYFLRCLRTPLPQYYTSNDTSRMSLAYFIIAGLDLLDLLEEGHTPSLLDSDSSQKLSADETRGYINWIYHCQVASPSSSSSTTAPSPTEGHSSPAYAEGGFRAFTGAHFGEQNRSLENQCWDPASVPATFFALVILLALGDDLSRVKRKECLAWLCQMQRSDGSFGQVLGPDGQSDGTRDLRFCFCAAGIRYILRGKEGKNLPDVADINVSGLISYVESCQVWEGGFAESPLNESHAGLTYCAIGTLSFLGCLQPSTEISPSIIRPGTTNYDTLIRWLVSRQTDYIEDESDDSEGEDQAQPQEHSHMSYENALSALPILEGIPAGYCAGFNGRTNKMADTCYCFWVSGTLAMLGQRGLVDAQANRRYLLGQTQHSIGGFGKLPGELPDLLHSYLGLAALALFDEEGIAELDPVLCASQRVRTRLEALPWWKNAEPA